MGKSVFTFIILTKGPFPGKYSAKNVKIAFTAKRSPTSLVRQVYTMTFPYAMFIPSLLLIPILFLSPIKYCLLFIPI